MKNKTEKKKKKEKKQYEYVSVPPFAAEGVLATSLEKNVIQTYIIGKDRINKKSEADIQMAFNEIIDPYYTDPAQVLFTFDYKKKTLEIDYIKILIII